MINLRDILRKTSVKKTSQSTSSIEDVDVQMTAIATNVSQLPKYEGIMDSSTSPAIWNNTPTNSDLVLLVLDGRRVVIAGSENGLKNKAALRQLRQNLSIHAYECEDAIGVSGDLLKLLGSSSRERSADRRTSLKSEPMMRFRSWLEKAVEMEGSDLHLETHDTKGFVRVRAHGEMWPLEDAVSGSYPAQQIIETISSVYQNLTQTASNSTAVWKPDADAYTMLNYEMGGKLVKMRFQAISGNKGPKAILRIFNGSDKPSKSLEELNYEKSQVAEIRKGQQTTSGLVCIAGITGSGKTTTIRSFLETHPENGSIIINTVEDPVELDIKGAHQKSVQRSFDDSEEEVRKKYIGSINAMLRGDIDIGMLGELRDSISANAWLNLAETGHMGIATLHAHRLTGIIPRLINETMGLTRDVLATPQNINLFMYQALVPKNCPTCSQLTEDILLNEEADHLTIRSNIREAERLGVDPTYFRWRNPSGCSACRGRGTSGQGLLAEIMTPDYQLLDHFRKGDDQGAFEYHRQRGNFNLRSNDLYCKSIVEHGLLKVFDGELDMRILSRFEKMSDFVTNYKRMKGGKE